MCGYQDRDGQGSVWIFTRASRDTKDWEQAELKLIPTDSIGRALYGYCLALSSTKSTGAAEFLVVEGPGDNLDRGACWVYKKTNSGWNYLSKLVESFPNAGQKGERSQYMTKYGSSVCISDNLSNTIRVVTGSPLDNFQMGGVLVFDGLISPNTDVSGETSFKIEFKQTSKIQNVINNEASQGESVAISSNGEKIMIGCPRNNSGCVIAYNHIGQDWIQDGEKIRGPDSIKNSRQGSSICMDSIGKTLAIGGPGDNDGIGAVWMFHKNNINNKWEFKTKIVCPESIGKSQVGLSVKLSKDGTYLIIGGPGDDNSTGAVWVYKFNEKNWIYLGEKYIGELHRNTSSVGSSVAIAISGYPVIAFGGPADDEGMGGVWITELSAL